MIFSLFKKFGSARAKGNLQNASTVDYKAYALSDVGMVRTNNEDNLIFIKPHDKEILQTKGCLAIVADGMGGHNCGEVASEMAIDVISEVYYKLDLNVEEALRKSVLNANKIIFNAGQKDGKRKGMGTTCTAVVLLGDQIIVGHVGDSRAYYVQGNQIKRMTKDHTYVEYLIAKGVVSEAERDSHPDGNIITKALGTHKLLDPDVFKIKYPFSVEAKILICSDGLYEYLKDDEMLRIVKNNDSSIAVKKLIQLAKNRGGHDNISALLIEQANKSKIISQKNTQEIL